MGILVLTLVTGLQNIGASAFVFMLPAFVKKDVEAGSVWLGLLWSAFGLGMLLASVSIAMVGRTRISRLLQLALMALVLGALSIVALSFVKVKLAAVTLMVVIGWSAAAFNPVVISLVQGCTPVDLRARVLTAFNSANMAAVTVGMMAFGWSANRLGNGPTLRGIAAVLLVSALTLGTGDAGAEHPTDGRRPGRRAVSIDGEELVDVASGSIEGPRSMHCSTARASGS